MEKIVTFQPAFDKRHSDPHKNYGIGAVVLRMVLKGELGATQFVLSTGWHLPNVSAELDNRILHSSTYRYYRPMPYDLGYHSPKPIYEDQNATDCDMLPNGKCYCDGSTLNADRIYEVLLRKGSDGVWQELEEYYKELFGELR